MKTCELCNGTGKYVVDAGFSTETIKCPKCSKDRESRIKEIESRLKRSLRVDYMKESWNKGDYEPFTFTHVWRDATEDMKFLLEIAKGSLK